MLRKESYCAQKQMLEARKEVRFYKKEGARERQYLAESLPDTIKQIELLAAQSVNPEEDTAAERSVEKQRLLAIIKN